MGRYHDALPTVGEAVTLYRVLAEDIPAAHQAGLAMALCGLGAALPRVGHYQDALAPAGEAVTLYRALAKDNPAAHQADLAGALANFGAALALADHYQDALPAIGEAVTFYRALADDNSAQQARLVGALCNLGAALTNDGRHQDALPTVGEAVALYRALAKDTRRPSGRPRQSTGQPRRRAALGWPSPGALAPAEEAVTCTGPWPRTTPPTRQTSPKHWTASGSCCPGRPLPGRAQRQDRIYRQFQGTGVKRTGPLSGAIPAKS